MLFLCLSLKERNGQSNCCFSPVIQMEILISLLKESKRGQVKGGGGWGGTRSTAQCKEEEEGIKLGKLPPGLHRGRLESGVQLDLLLF